MDTQNSNQLLVDAAYHSVVGRKAINEDCAGVEIPEDAYRLQNKGVSLVVSDGVSTAEAGREASHTVVERFLEEYYQTPDTWSVAHAGEKILSTINLRLFRKSHEFSSESKGYLSTVSALVLKSHSAHFFHVGDSRIYRLSADDKSFEQVTHDHTAVQSYDKTFLARAMGMDNRLHLDYGRIELQQGDRFLLSSDGVHDFIKPDDIKAILATGNSAKTISKQLVDLAFDNGSDDNITALVAIIDSLSEETLDDYSVKLTRLPFPPEFDPGMKVDGYEVEKEIFASSRSQLYLVKDLETGHNYAMKTPSFNFEDDLNYIDRFIQEEWVGSRIHHDNVVEIISQSRPRTCLYYLMEYLQGEGLDKWIAKQKTPSPRKNIAIIKQIASALKAFHDNEAIHQDLKPANIFLVDQPDSDVPKVVVLDFGSVYVAGLAELQRPLNHEGALGTAGYSDPLYLMGRNPGIQGDIYALATICYELFTGKLPYGERIEECKTAFDYDRLRYHSASTHNPVIPVWFDKALEKGVAFDLEQRYKTIEDFMRDLTQPNPEFLKDDPVVEKNTSSLLFWKLLSGFWFLTFILVIYLFSQQ